MNSGVAILGAGIISALGVGWKESVTALKRGTCNIGPIRFLKTEHSEIPCAEVGYSNAELKQMIGLEDVTEVVPRSSLLAIVAAREAIKTAGISRIAGLGGKKRIAFLHGTTVGGMDIAEQEAEPRKSPFWGYDAATRCIIERLGIPISYVDIISTACSAAANAIGLGAELLRLDKADIVIAGGAECLTRYHLNGFNSLLILDPKPCRPFEPEHAGLNLGEGAGYVVMIRSYELSDYQLVSTTTNNMATTNSYKVNVLGEVAGYGNACDAFHQTASSPEGDGAVLAMEKALKKAGLEPRDIDYINAHGTGTPNNDASESAAIRRVFGRPQADGQTSRIPPFSSTKNLTGHATSAAGGIEAVVSLIMLQLRPEWRNVLSNSFGFGGNDTALIFSKATAKDKTAISNQSVITRPNPQTNALNKVVTTCNRECYINSSVCVTGDRNIDTECKKHIAPTAARRMTPRIKRTIITAVKALEEASVKMPDAIITSTVKDCGSDSLDSTKPSLFINSTPNALGSQVAIHLKCRSYNNTHIDFDNSHRGAIEEARLLIESGEAETVLLNFAGEDNYSFVLSSNKRDNRDSYV